MENLSWHQALTHAKEHLIFFVPQAMNGEAVFPHPLLDELKLDDADVLTPEKLVAPSGEWRLAGRTAKLESKTPVEPKVKTTIGANEIAPTRRLSYSQLNSLIACPFQWFMDKYLELRMPPAMNVPTGPPMIGTLAHRVVEDIYRGKETLTVEAAVSAAKEKFDELLPSMAAELLLDGRNVERERVRNTLAEAVAVLVEEINALGLRVKGSEKELHGTFAGCDFIGYYDLCLEDAAGNQFVIDMKWSSRPDYEQNLKENKALQLAAYSWLLDPQDLNVRCAYFLFPKKQFLFDPAITWNELWENAEQSWKQRMDEIHAGRLARGTADEKQLETSPLALPLSAECKYCNYAALCAMTED